MAALAQTIGVVIAGRSIQGIGGGGILTLSEVVITDLIPLRERGKWVSLQSAVWSIGTVTGPLIGGGLAGSGAWRWLFWLNLPFVAVAAPVITYFLQLRLPPSTSFLSDLGRVDWVGSIVFVASVSGFMIPLAWGGLQYSWDSWHTIVPLVVCAAGLIFFIVHQELLSRQPLIPTDIFKTRSAMSLYLQDFLHGLILWCIMYNLPLYFQAVKEYSPFKTAVALLPLCLTISPAAAVAGIMIGKLGRYRWALWSGWILATAGSGVLIILQVHTSTVEFVFLTLIGGIGLGMLFTSMGMALQAVSRPEDQAYAMTVQVLLRNLGQTVGVAVGGNVFIRQLRKKLLTFPSFESRADELSKDAVALISTIHNMAASPDKDHLKDAYAYGLQYVWIVLTVLGFVGLVSSVFVEGRSLDQELKTEQGFQNQLSATKRKSSVAQLEVSEYELNSQLYLTLPVERLATPSTLESPGQVHLPLDT